MKSLGMRISRSPFLSILLSTLSFYISMASSSSSDPIQDTFLQCLTQNPQPNSPISSLIYTPNNPSYTSVLQSYIRNLRFTSPSTPKPSFIIAPTHISHIQTAIICSKKHGFQIRIRSGGHDYDGLSYVSDLPFLILDMFNLRSVDVNLEDETVWVESGATIGELYYKIAEKSQTLGFPAGVCPTVGVGGHFSGGGYGNLMRKHGLTVDNVIDACLVDANGEILNRESMGEDLFWAIRGGGGASFGVIVSWKIKLVHVPEIVTVFRTERTLEQNATDIVHKWQFVADKIDNDLFIRVVVLPSMKKDRKTIKAKFVSLFLGNGDRLVELMNENFGELGIIREDCIEMSWVESVLYWSNYEKGTPISVLLERIPKSEKFLKKKSDYVTKPVSKPDLEGIWEKMIELKKPVMTFNPYGGRMSEISELDTAFPHRKGNMFKIQYSVNWKDEGVDAADRNVDLIRKLYDYMTPFVSKSPRGSYLNYRDVDLGVNGNGGGSYLESSVWGEKYFKGNFERLVCVKTMVDPNDFFRYEQSIPSLARVKSVEEE